MATYDLIVADAHDWAAIERSLVACSQGQASDVVFVAEPESLPEAETSIGVLVYSVTGMGQYVLQVYPKALIPIPQDALAMHIAVSAQTKILISSDAEAPQLFLECGPDGKLADVVVDLKKLDEEGILDYRPDAQQNRIDLNP